MWLTRLAGLGHEVACSALSYSGAQLNWNGIPVLPAWQDTKGGQDILNAHAEHVQADLVITLCDPYVLRPAVLQRLRVACWLPIDAEPWDRNEAQLLTDAGAVPVAMSRFGERVIRERGLQPMYVPHGVDTAVFSPQDKAEARRAHGLDEDTFIIGLCAANRDIIRKGFDEQFRAFAAFRERHPDSLLLVHSCEQDPQALDLAALATDCGILGSVGFPDQYAYVSGAISGREMAAWYNCLDVLSNCSYGEGFGLPVLEAQACGVPVVVTAASAMPELCGSGLVVECDPLDDAFWVPLHRARWMRPRPSRIAAAYENLWLAREEGRMPGLSDAAREFALGYDADLVAAQYWKPVLEQIMAR